MTPAGGEGSEGRAVVVRGQVSNGTTAQEERNHECRVLMWSGCVRFEKLMRRLSDVLVVRPDVRKDRNVGHDVVRPREI